MSGNKKKTTKMVRRGERKNSIHVRGYKEKKKERKKKRQLNYVDFVFAREKGGER